MNDKTEKLIIVGKSGSGKDWLLRQLGKEGLRVSTKTTTRPKRKNESTNYNFISDDEFKLLLENKKLLCHQSFRVTPEKRGEEIWHYGLTKEEFDNAQAFIMTPGEVRQLTPEIRKGCFLVYLDIDQKTRESRISKRNDNNDSVKRRLEADEEDFKEFNDYDLKITDPDFEVEMVLSLMF